MFQCGVCGSTQVSTEFVSEVFNIDGKLLLVEQIPAQVCANCGELTFSREVTEKIRRMVLPATKVAATVTKPTCVG